jgi:hypothetical protein
VELWRLILRLWVSLRRSFGKHSITICGFLWTIGSAKDVEAHKVVMDDHPEAIEALPCNLWPNKKQYSSLRNRVSFLWSY